MKDSFFTLTFFPRKPRSEGNGEYPLYARITTEGQKIEFTIGRKVNPAVWDQRAQKSNAYLRNSHDFTMSVTYRTSDIAL